MIEPLSLPFPSQAFQYSCVPFFNPTSSSFRFLQEQKKISFPTRYIMQNVNFRSDKFGLYDILYLYTERIHIENERGMNDVDNQPCPAPVPPGSRLGISKGSPVTTESPFRRRCSSSRRWSENRVSRKGFCPNANARNCCCCPKHKNNKRRG